MAAQQFVQKTVTQLLSTKQFQDFWVQANRVAHAAAVKILKGETIKGVSTANGEVTLNLFPMISQALTVVGEKAPGILGGDRIPKLTASITPDQARAKLSAALGRPLPADFGVITVFKSDQLKLAQEGLKLFNAVIVVVLILTVLLFAAHDRPGPQATPGHHRPGPGIGGRPGGGHRRRQRRSRARSSAWWATPRPVTRPRPPSPSS